MTRKTPTTSTTPARLLRVSLFALRHTLKLDHVARIARRNASQAVCLVMVFCLLATSTPAAPQAIVGAASASWTSAAFWFHSSGLAARLQGAHRTNPKKQEKQSDRDARVSRLRIQPGDVTVYEGQQIIFTATAYDANDAAIGGTQAKWSAQDAESQEAVRISQHGEFTATITGTFKITAEVAGQTAQVTVTVLEGLRRKKNEKPSKVRNVSSRDRQSKKSAAAPPSQLQKNGRFRDAKFIRAADSGSGGDVKYIRAGLRTSPVMQQNQPALDDPNGWNNGNYPSLGDPGNSVGNPPGAPADGGAGSGNFQMAAPVAALPGRGLSVTLGLVYNSRVWNKSGNDMTYDIDHDSPAPGWSLGFGKMLGLGVGNGILMVDADGTRHGFTGAVTSFYSGSSFAGHTTDGSFIDYQGEVSTSGGIYTAQARLPNGTTILYSAPGAGGVYPTRITDANGNYITITYVNNAGPQISTVTDTLGRTLNFYYDAANPTLLTAINGPDLNGGTRTLVRLHYKHINLRPDVNYGFSLTTHVRDANPWVIDAIYYPSTQTGYWFGDSYSSYGMIAKVSEQRAMIFSASSLTEQGTVSLTANSETKQELYTYPLQPAVPALTDAPTYDSLTETWDGIGAVAAPVTQYNIQTPAGGDRVTTITLPNGTKSIQSAYNHPGLFDDGLVYKDETRDAQNNLLRSSIVQWEAGDYGSPRPHRTDATNNEINQTTHVEFVYGSYNQVTEVRNYDYNGALLNKTVTGYENGANYINRHIFNLPNVVQVYGSDGATRVSRTEYQHDIQSGQQLQNTPNVVMHDDAYNPFAPIQTIPQQCYYDCDVPTGQRCIRTCEPARTVTPYVASTDYRGLVTQVKTYADAVNLTGAIIEDRRYDITGNLVTATTSCCQQMSFGYSSNTQYAYPESKTRGSSDVNSAARVTTSAVYDFNTGLAKSATDANGRTSQTQYTAGTLRPQTATLPTGAYTTFAYDDAAMTVGETTKDAGGGIASDSTRQLNGLGQVRHEEARGAGNVWDIVETKYDNLGRAVQQTRPYRSGDAQQWSTTEYDSLGRVKITTAPDGSTSQVFYNEANRPDAALGGQPGGETTRVVDAWGRERWGRTDAQGRLAEIVEPRWDSDGTVASSGYLTTYGYDTLGNLTLITQGEQVRRFRYDALGRMTNQKLAEQTATLDDNGQYVGGGQWSEFFAYDEKSNMTSRVDARGVMTSFDYGSDPLNRLQSVSYTVNASHDTSSAILAAASTAYEYMTTGDVSRIFKATTAGVSTEEYHYDSEGRADSQTMTLQSRASFPMVTSYTYDTLDRVTDVYYPTEYGAGANGANLAGKHIHHDYDAASRLAGLQVDGASYASAIDYNASSQTKQLNIGVSGANQITETYGYEAATGLLTNQRVQRAGTSLLDLSYDYARSASKGTLNGRTGQLTKILNNLDHNKDRGYSYDALGRLMQATGGAQALWTQDYRYDRFGNKLSVAAAGTTAASLQKPAEPKAAMPTEHLAWSSGIPTPNELFGVERKDVSDAVMPLFGRADGSKNAGAGSSAKAAAAAATSAPLAMQSGTPVFTDDPIQAGVTVIRAVHITELRAAVNQARARAGLAAAVWTTDPNLSSGYAIRGAHITELRTALDGARTPLGLAAAAYTYMVLSAGSPVHAADIQELRERVRETLGASPPPSPSPTPAPTPTPLPGCGIGQTQTSSAFVANFYVSALNRQPSTSELAQWTNNLRAAAGQGQSAVLSAAQSLGRTLFTSPEYVNRNRADRDYVYDLYKAYLQREPEQGGWDYYTGQLTNPDPAQRQTRAAVRTGFDQSVEFGQVVGRVCAAVAANNGSGQSVPRDGAASLAYDTTTNRITTAGYAYDAAGNQTHVVNGYGTGQRYVYDAANRMVQVTDDSNRVLASYTYGSGNERLISDEGGYRTYYAWSGEATIAEYGELSGTGVLSWNKSYVFLGARLLATLQPNGAGGESTQFHHPDRLGTRLITNAYDTNYFEQVSLPYGTALDAESSGATNRRFTSYDRSNTTGLDYAVNRHYDAVQGRFTQADPLGMGASSLADPQSLNMYAYCGGDPINRTDPSGLFWGKLFKFISKAFKVVLVAAAIVAAVVGVLAISGFFSPLVGVAFGLKLLAASALGFASAFGPPWVGQAIGIAGGVVSIYRQAPGIITNFASIGAAKEGTQALARLATVGAVANSFQNPNRGNRKQRRSYKSAEAAAIAALRANNVRSIKEDREYAGRVCERIDGSFTYTVGPANARAKGTSDPGDCPSDTTLADSWHTHGRADPNDPYSPFEEFSGSDIEGANADGVREYMSAPTGRIRMYDPNNASQRISNNPAIGHISDAEAARAGVFLPQRAPIRRPRRP